MLLMANSKSLADLQTLFSDNDFRDLLLESVGQRKNDSTEFPLLLDSWQRYKKLMRTDQWIVWVEPILTRIAAAAGDQSVIQKLTRSENNIDLDQVITQKQILVVKLDTTTDSRLVGNLLVALMANAAAISQSKIKNPITALYIDHLEAILSATSFQALTGESVKNRIGVTGALQSLHSLAENFQKALLDVQKCLTNELSLSREYDGQSSFLAVIPNSSL